MDNFFSSINVNKKIDEQVLIKEIIPKLKDFALMTGGGFRSKQNFSEDSLQIVPFTLLPTLVNKEAFNRVIDLQPKLNELYHKIAHNDEFLESALSNVALNDEFMGNLFKIYKTVRSEGISQPLSLGLVRNDLMMITMNDSKISAKQIEFNTIAAGFPWLGPCANRIHRLQ